jgi:cytoskeleton-associated protein 5
MLNNLKEGLKKELDTFWETYDTSIVMTAPKEAKQEDGGKGKGKKVDAYDLSEAVDVFKKFNEKWAESVLKAEKWN